MPHGLAHAFTPETARANQAKAAVAFRKNRETLKAKLARLQAVEKTLAQREGSAFTDGLIMRIRAQCQRLLDCIDHSLGAKEPDGQQLNWLASALERMAELERVLAGRPTPGALRPSAAAARRAAMPSFSVTVPDQEPAPAAPAPELSPPTKESL